MASVTLRDVSKTYPTRTGGAKVLHATVRVVVWGALAMAVTAGVGRLLGVAAS